MATEEWQDVADRLERLVAVVPAQHGAFVERLRRAVSARRPYSIQEMCDLIAMLEAVSERAERGEDPQRVLADTEGLAQRFEQQGWSPNNVYNARQIVLQGTAPGDIPAAEEEALAVPVVLAAMTACDLQELLSGDAFRSLPDTLAEHFEQLRTLLSEEGLDDWTNRYGEAAVEWKPFGADGPTVAALVRDTFVKVNDHEGYTPAIVPEFHDISAIQGDRAQLRRLRSGCLVIMDNLSMRHPKLQGWFHRSMLDAYPTTAMLSIAPIQRALEASRELSVFVHMRLDELEFSRRLSDLQEDIGTCLETADPQQLEQWLATGIRKIAPDVGAKAGILSHMRIGPGASESG